MRLVLIWSDFGMNLYRIYIQLSIYPRKSHWHLHRGMRQRSRGKDTKSLWNKLRLNKKKVQKLRNIRKSAYLCKHMNNNTDFLPKFTLDQLADCVAMKMEYFKRRLNPDTVWNIETVIKPCRMIEDEPRYVNTVIVEVKKDTSSFEPGTNIKRYHAILTRIYILLYYRNRDNECFKKYVFPRLINNMGGYGVDNILKYKINQEIDKIKEQDKLFEQARKPKEAQRKDDNQTTTDYNRIIEEQQKQIDTLSIENGKLKEENDKLSSPTEAAIKLSAEISRLKNEKTEILKELLLPIFFNQENDVVDFLGKINGLQDNEITDLVYEWAHKERKISTKQCNSPLWKILHAFKYYNATSTNWDTALRNHPKINSK